MPWRVLVKDPSLLPKEFEKKKSNPWWPEVLWPPGSERSRKKLLVLSALSLLIGFMFLLQEILKNRAISDLNKQIETLQNENEGMISLRQENKALKETNRELTQKIEKVEKEKTDDTDKSPPSKD